MESVDDAIILVIKGDNEAEETKDTELNTGTVTMKQVCNKDKKSEIGDTLENTKKYDSLHTEVLIEDIKDEVYDAEYLDEEYAINSDEDPEYKIQNNEDETEPVNKETDKSKLPKKTKKKKPKKYPQYFRLRKPHECYSFIAEIVKEYPDISKDKEVFVSYIAQLMRDIVPPPLPKDYYKINAEKKFKCMTCDGVFPKINVMNRHYHEKHGPRYLDCFACGTDFRRTTELYKHERRCQAPDAPLMLAARTLALDYKRQCHRPDKPTNADFNRFKFPCPECRNVSFVSKVGLDAHLHTHRGERPFQCTRCPAAYTSRSALNRHRLKHTNSRFECDLCGRVFQSKAIIINHLNTHRPQKKYACSIAGCEKRFSQKMALDYHVKITHNCLPPPCACQVCFKRFPRMFELKKHMQKAHRLTMMTRTMFFKRLPMLSKTEIEKAKVILKSDQPYLIKKKLDSRDVTKENIKEGLSQDDSEEVSKHATEPAYLDLVAQVLESLEDVEEFMRDNEDCETFVVEDGEVQRTVAMADLRQAYNNKKDCEI